MKFIEKKLYLNCYLLFSKKKSSLSQNAHDSRKYDIRVYLIKTRQKIQDDDDILSVSEAPRTALI